jgi:urease accessory protein
MAHDGDAALLHLLRLVSPSLPVGAFSYSRGLEFAAEAGWISDEASARDWIFGALENSFTPLDGALFWRMMAALAAGGHDEFRRFDAWLAAARESRELQLEDRRLGEALLRLLVDLGVPETSDGVLVAKDGALTYQAAFAIAAHHWGIAPGAALMGLMWSMIETQVAAAIRLGRLGHTAGQRILIAAVPVVERCAAVARTIEDDAIGNVGVAMAMASAWHETQYSRLFRS